ncbi:MULTISPECIES: hypothetical protein [Bradyrhizobium]|uniref:hypothetical protein n=1 Tax=Bradyrhizobium TaxID=374 RepID=UPI001EDBA274|nr:hypothetical protein [Bradyrhizobium zhengyangense]MCG2638585.1 hypothetical protein [Bradyrhizobium zhengyangense]
MQQQGLRLVCHDDPAQFGTLEFGDGGRPGGGDRKERIRREIVDTHAAGIANVGADGEGDDGREYSRAAVEDQAREKHAREQQKIARRARLHLQCHLQDGAGEHDARGDGVPGEGRKLVLQN